MVRYETLMLAVPEITSEETSKLENQFTKMVKAIKGNVISFEKWGKYKLAYPVRKNDYGVYFLTRFELPNDLKDKFFLELKDMFAIKYNDIVMRYIISALPKTESLEYQRPRSLEETPKDVDNIMKKSNHSSHNDSNMMMSKDLAEDENDNV